MAIVVRGTQNRPRFGPVAGGSGLASIVQPRGPGPVLVPLDGTAQEEIAPVRPTSMPFSSWHHPKSQPNFGHAGWRPAHAS